jgi:homoserine kinase type II
VDNAAAGQRGTRAIASADLEEFLRAHWGVRPATAAPDLGGSVNLNLLVTDGRSLRVARVYRPFVTGQRVAALQAVRCHLASHGVPCAGTIPTLGGRGWETFQGRAVEVEPFVTAPAAMHTLVRVRTGLAMLGRIHALLQAFPVGPAAAAPRFANYVAATDLVQAVAAGTRRIRAWRPTPPEARLADLADQLAETLAGWDLDCPVPIRRQLVHGDFWDDNVRFRRRQVALVTDFDFLGERPRTDDLALTLYYTSVDISDITRDPAQLTGLVAAYEAGLGTRLSPHERAAIPLAIARQPLWSIAVWVALLDNQDTARRHLAATGAELKWALQLTGRIAHVQDALTEPLPIKAHCPADLTTNASAQQNRTPDQLRQAIPAARAGRRRLPEGSRQQPGPVPGHDRAARGRGGRGEVSIRRSPPYVIRFRAAAGNGRAGAQRGVRREPSVVHPAVHHQRTRRRQVAAYSA